MPIAEAIIDLVKERSMMTDLIDVADYRITATGDEAGGLERYRELMTAADGLVIVAPEYNHAYPGELKLLLDSEFAAYARKPVGFVSVSSGRIGGTRLVEQLRLLTTALRMVPVSPAVHVVDVNRALDEHGRFASDSLEQVANDMLDEVARFAHALVPAGAQRA
jgi:NAD(P)H-dependent FMN reductase